MGGFGVDSSGTNILYADNVDFSGSDTQTKQINTDGQLLIGSTASPNIKSGFLGSTDGSITWTTGSGTLTGQVSGGTTVGKTITGNTGGALSPVAGNWDTLGVGSITIAGAGNTLTTQLTGLTNHAVLVGAGTTTITKLAVGTNGQVLIAATAADPAFATLTSTGGTIAFTLGANTLNLDVSGGGFTWTNVSGTSATMVKENAYQSNNAGLVTLTMPSVASSTFGDTIKVGGFGSGGWLIQCVATQLIHFGNQNTSAAGSLASTNRYDQVELVCSSTTTEWFVVNSVGNISVA